MKHPRAALPSFGISLRSRFDNFQKEGTVTFSYYPINYLLETYGKDDVINKTDAYMMPFTQMLNKLSIKYAEALWSKALRIDKVFE